MKPQEVELWAREIVAGVLSQHPVEDFRVELKTDWIEPKKAAPRLAAHANAARGVPILWLIGVNEKSFSLTDVKHLERESWYTSTQKYFDGFAPRLLVDVNVIVEDKTIVALYFETEKEAPYVIKNSSGGGGYPEYVVPWREGTRLRAASREDLLRILVPIRRFSALIDELEFNIAICEETTSADFVSWGCPFRDEEFHRALREGAMVTLSKEVKQSVFQAYFAMGQLNQRAAGILRQIGTYPEYSNQKGVKDSVTKVIPKIQDAYNALSSFLRGQAS
jgi:hypothetical protein